MESLLSIRGLNVEFQTPSGPLHVLRDINIDVPKGKILGIVGESGSGKSTVIWAINRLLASNGAINGGAAIFDGQDLFALNERQMLSVRGEQISMVFQDPMTSQIPVLTYDRQMSDIQYRRKELSIKEKRERAIKIMHKVGIPDPEDRILQYPHHFSGGMRQRAGIAMALLMDPLLLIADEPTTALDVTLEAQIIHLIQELRAEFEATIMVVSHNLGLIAELCDQVVVMYAGEVVEYGSVSNLFYEPAHPYTQALLNCDPARTRTKTRYLPVIPGDVPDLHVLPTGCIFAARCLQVMEQCKTTAPAKVQLDDSQHVVSCHLLDPGLQASRDAPKNVSPQGDALGEARPKPSVESGELLKVDDLCVRFQTNSWIRSKIQKRPRFVDAVIDASLSLGQGETLGLVGESGSGKTTLGRAILGLVQAESGSVRFDGQDLRALSRTGLSRLRRDMAMMFQDPVGSLSPRQTVRALITEPFQIHRINADLDEEAARLCEMVRLPQDFLSRYPHELSGGQARRVGVARALALNPRIIIADEPTAGLDVSVQGEILNLMNELQETHGLSYLIISHNLPVIRHVSDRLAIMYLGRLVEFGNSDEIFSQPTHPYTQALVNGVPQPDPNRRRSLVSIEGEVPSLANRPAGCEFHTRCKYATDDCRNTRPPLSQIRVNGLDREVACHYPLAGESGEQERR